MKSTKYPDNSLFITIEQEYSDGPVKFYYVSSHEPDTRVTIPSLPLIVSGHFGKTSALTWFQSKCWVAVSKYSFEFMDDDDHDKGARLFYTTDDHEQELDHEWDQDTNDTELEHIGEDDGNFLIANIDLANLQKDKEFTLGDDGCSTQTDYTSRSQDSQDDQSSTQSPTPRAVDDSATVTLDSTITPNSMPDHASTVAYINRSTGIERQAILKLLTNTGGQED